VNFMVEDTPDEDFPNGLFFVTMIVGAIAYFIFAHFGQSGRGFVAMLSIAAIVGVIYILRAFMKLGKFWMAVALVSALHVVIIILVPPDLKFSFGVVFAPVVILDMYLSYRFIGFISKNRGGVQ
jgi:hypothetical protein